MIIGISIALAILLIIGFIILKYSVKLPISAFFKVTTFIIYALSFKMLGVSIHSLQVSQIVPIHSVHGIPFIEEVGLYPTLETTLPQISFIILLFVDYLLDQKRKILWGQPFNLVVSTDSFKIVFLYNQKYEFQYLIFGYI